VKGKTRGSDIRRAQYEFPGFAAGIVGSHTDNALTLLERRAKVYKADAYIEAVIRELQAVRTEIGAWQRFAQMVTDYDAARREVEHE
jgi:hypothetical protein